MDGSLPFTSATTRFRNVRVYTARESTRLVSTEGAVAKFKTGQIVKHLKFGYRGVVFQADGEFALSEDWYDQVARSRPPKDAPWYHVLVDKGIHSTYVAERHLTASGDRTQITHPSLGEHFESYDGLAYQPHILH